MAWRIDEHVIRGEIDNRIRNRVTGRICFFGRDDPISRDDGNHEHPIAVLTTGLQCGRETGRRAQR